MAGVSEAADIVGIVRISVCHLDILGEHATKQVNIENEMGQEAVRLPFGPEAINVRFFCGGIIRRSCSLTSSGTRGIITYSRRLSDGRKRSTECYQQENYFFHLSDF